MPFYQFTVKLKGKTLRGIRESPLELERVYHMAQLKCEQKFAGDMLKFDCVQISKRSDVYKDWIKAKTAGQKDDLDV